MAVSTDLLEFYQTLFEESCDAVNALASALHKFYLRRGFEIEDSRVSISIHLRALVL
jgi:hypothetical protein